VLRSTCHFEDERVVEELIRTDTATPLVAEVAVSEMRPRIWEQPFAPLPEFEIRLLSLVEDDITELINLTSV
jgi:hypothetical protein